MLCIRGQLGCEQNWDLKCKAFPLKHLASVPTVWPSTLVPAFCDTTLHSDSHEL